MICKISCIAKLDFYEYLYGLFIERLMNFEGIIIGAATFLIIGIFHPIVIKAEYHFGKGCWWAFLLAGAGFLALSLFLKDTTLSTLAGVVAFSSFWSILELFHQEKRVQKGWFPKKPGRK